MKKRTTDENSRFQLLDFFENPNLGVFCRSNDKIAFIQKGLLKKVKKRVITALDVKLVEITIAESTIIGSLLTMNSKGVVVTDLVDEESYKIIEGQGLDVFVIDEKINAAGNDILVNDFGALVHPDFKSKTVKKIAEVLQVPVYQGKIANLDTVGMAAVVTNKGLLCHPKATDEDISSLKDIFDVEVMIGTVNHGVPLIGSGLVANTKGAIIGNLTTGIELGRIEEALNF